MQALVGRSRSAVRGLFDHQCVRVNDEICLDLGRTAQRGDCVCIQFDPHRRYREKPDWRDSAFSIVFEDRELIVVDKTAQVLSVPTDRVASNTLVQRVANYLRHRGAAPHALVIHRLDRGVSGLLVFAKTRESARRLHAQFRSHTPRRTYLALVHGPLAAQEGTFRSHLATGKNLDRYSTSQAGGGEWAITHYRVLQRLSEATFVTIRLETGRRNQIRVHFAEAGHPVLGDPRYGRTAVHPSTWTLRRLALHAARLEFEHPQTGQPLAFESPLPPPLQKYVTQHQVQPAPATRPPPSRRDRR